MGIGYCVLRVKYIDIINFIYIFSIYTERYNLSWINQRYAIMGFWNLQNSKKQTKEAKWWI